MAQEVIALEGELAKYGDVRGFNYQPSYASHGIEIWGDKFDIQKIDREIGLGKQFFPGINTIRIWLSHEAYLQNPKRFVKHVDSVIDLADKYDVRMIVMLFSGWHAIPDFGGLSIDTFPNAIKAFDYICAPYIEDVVGRHSNDDRVLFWDLCNEPCCTAQTPEARQIVFDFLKKVYDHCKVVGAEAPICVGVTPGYDMLELMEPISDVLTNHPYYAANGWIRDKEHYCELLDKYVGFAKSVNKPLVATECCWGSYDDAERTSIVEFELAELVKRNIGFTPHLLHETLVADGHRPHLAMTAHPLKLVGYMAFINIEGTVRPGHEVYNKFV